MTECVSLEEKVILKLREKGMHVTCAESCTGGMIAASLLQDTEAALRKMEYVFHCFERHKDAALIWRPHPLMETT